MKITLLFLAFTFLSFSPLGHMDSCEDLSANLESIIDSEPTVYQDANYYGNSVNLWCTEPNLHRHGWGDKFSSCRVPDGWEIVFYESTGYRGAKFTVTRNVTHFKDFGWDNTPSSVKVYYNGVLQKNCTWKSNKKKVQKSKKQKAKDEPGPANNDYNGNWDGDSREW